MGSRHRVPLGTVSAGTGKTTRGKKYAAESLANGLRRLRPRTGGGHLAGCLVLTIRGTSTLRRYSLSTPSGYRMRRRLAVDFTIPSSVGLVARYGGAAIVREARAA